MKTAAIAIDDWKLEIFKKHLDKAGYKYKKCKGLTENMFILSVKTKSIAKLQPVVKAAQIEAAEYKKSRIIKNKTCN